MSDDTPTARQTPQSKSFAPGLEPCPQCNRKGLLLSGVQCPYCFGGRVVSKEKAEEWRKAHPHDPDKLPDTDPAPEESCSKE